MLNNTPNRAVSDPDDIENRAWEDAEGNENGDKCAYKFGKTLRSESGVKYNMQIGQYKYLIQENWSLQKQACALSNWIAYPVEASR